MGRRSRCSSRERRRALRLPQPSYETLSQARPHPDGKLAGPPEMRDTTVLDRGNLAHGSAAPAIANDVDQDVDALGDLTRYRRFSKLSRAREQQREAVDGTRRRTRMYGREGAFVPG